MVSSSSAIQDPRVILIAPIASASTPGQSNQILEIHQELERQGIEVHQIAHERNRRELEDKFPRMHITFLKDSAFARLLNRMPLFGPFYRTSVQRRAAKLAMRIAGHDGRTVIHYTAPISPSLPIFRTPDIAVIVGPINGKLHYPPAFRRRETFREKFSRWMHPTTQRIQRAFFKGRQDADALLVAGGQRTYESLLLAGAKRWQLVDSVQRGVRRELLDIPRITHEGKNLKFVHAGHLVPAKSADLAIKALARTRNPIELQVIGDGPEREKLERLARKLFVSERITFSPWINDSTTLIETMRSARGFVFPALAEPAGVAIQEAMAVGLPVICVDWGGPSLLVDTRSGYPIKPVDEEFVVNEIARAMDELCENPDRAEQMSKAARELASTKDFFWPDIVTRWIELYKNVTGAHADRVIVARPKAQVKIAIESIGDRPATAGLLSEEFDAMEHPSIHIEQ